MVKRFAPHVDSVLAWAAKVGIDDLYKNESVTVLTSLMETSTKKIFPKKLGKVAHDRYTKLKDQLPEGIYDTLSQLIQHLSISIKTIKTDSVTYSPLMVMHKEFGPCKRMKYNKGNIITGRNDEIDSILLTLCKKNKRGAILVGEPGVGKTAIVGAINSRLIQRNVPRQLIGSEILMMDIPYIFSKYKEDPFGVIISILETASKYDKAILFIDEVHQLLSQRMNDIMKPYLTEKIRFIGSTTINEYHSIITEDTALERRFTVVRVDEPNITRTTKMILGTKSVFEEYHKCTIPENVCQYMVETGSRFLGHRKNPDKSLDLLDIACSIMYEEEIANVCKEPPESKDFLKQIEKERLRIKSLKTIANDRVLTNDYVDKAISNVTGISYGEIANSLNYPEVRKEMSKRVFGQDEAIKSVANIVNIFKHVKSEREHPVSMLLMVGPAGVGKKSSAQSLAKQLFGKKEYFIDYDMSSFKEGFTISELKGSPPGYVGYGKSGVLIKSIRNNPQSVVYFRGINKAHDSIKQYLVDGCRSGKLTDTAEREAKLNNSIIIFSVTLDDKEMEQFRKGKANTQMGFSKGEDKTNSVLEKEALSTIVGKDLVDACDEIVIYNELNQTILGQIYDDKVQEYLDMYNNVDIDQQRLRDDVLEDSKNGHDIVSKLSSEVPKQVFRKFL